MCNKLRIAFSVLRGTLVAVQFSAVRPAFKNVLGAFFCQGFERALWNHLLFVCSSRPSISSETPLVAFFRAHSQCSSSALRPCTTRSSNPCLLLGTRLAYLQLTPPLDPSLLATSVHIAVVSSLGASVCLPRAFFLRIRVVWTWETRQYNHNTSARECRSHLVLCASYHVELCVAMSSESREMTRDYFQKRTDE